MSKQLKSLLSKEKAAELGLQLMNREMLNDESLVELTEDLRSFVNGLLKNNEKVILRDFLLMHKDHLTPTMKDLISEAIKQMNPGRIYD